MQSRREFHPELIPRRGEWIAWGLALVALAVLGVLFALGARLPLTGVLLAGLLTLSAASISLGNWMDRHTVLMLHPDGVRFRNGLRNVSLSWDDIREVRVADTSLGRRVQVRGEKDGFVFRTLGEVWARDELKGRTGFLEGERILKEIVRAAGLQESRQQDDVQYYARP